MTAILESIINPDYLRLTGEKRDPFDPDIRPGCNAAAKASKNHLRHSLYTCPLAVKAAVYTCIVRPLLEYASPDGTYIQLAILNS